MQSFYVFTYSNKIDDLLTGDDLEIFNEGFQQSFDLEYITLDENINEHTQIINIIQNKHINRRYYIMKKEYIECHLMCNYDDPENHLEKYYLISYTSFAETVNTTKLNNVDEEALVHDYRRIGYII